VIRAIKKTRIEILVFNKYKRGTVLAMTYSCLATTIGAAGLNFRVRDGNGCTSNAKITKTLPLLDSASSKAIFHANFVLFMCVVLEIAPV
jgi:hypothetical protein